MPKQEGFTPATHRERRSASHFFSGKTGFERIHMVLEVVSFIAIIVAAPLALIELHRNADKERLDLAEQTYRQVDERYMDFMKLCLDNPRLDCYSVARGKIDPPLTDEERWKQRILYSALTDLFEVAYVDYHQPEVSEKVKALFDDQWAGWDAYIRKFLKRDAYRATWFDLRDEYDKGYVRYVDRIAPPPVPFAK